MSTDPKSTKFDVTNSKYELVGPSGRLRQFCQAPCEACLSSIHSVREALEQWHGQLHDLGSTPCQAGRALHT